MSNTSTVSGLIGRFALRRRATTAAFAEGVRLARLGAVTLDLVSPGEIRAQVEECGSLFAVRVFASDGQLLGDCACNPEEHVPCRHQVAVAHVVWVKGRRGVT